MEEKLRHKGREREKGREGRLVNFEKKKLLSPKVGVPQNKGIIVREL